MAGEGVEGRGERWGRAGAGPVWKAAGLSSSMGVGRLGDAGVGWGRLGAGPWRPSYCRGEAGLDCCMEVALPWGSGVEASSGSMEWSPVGSV